MKIQILCQECEKFEKNVVAAVNELGIEYELERIFERKSNETVWHHGPAGAGDQR